MQKILVLGATGHLGSNTAVYLKSIGYDVVAVGHRKSDNGFFSTKGIPYIGNFSIENEQCFLLFPKDIDAVVHLAGTMPAHANANPMPYIQSIVVGMVNVCEWMKDIGCKKIIFNTTPSDVCAFFGEAKPVDDDAPRSFPKDGGDHAVYAIAKNTAVDILEHYHIAYDFTYTVFRHLTVYGYQENPYYNLNGEKKMLPWRQIMQNCIDGKAVEIWGDPNRKKELLYIKDFTKAIECALQKSANGIFNLGGDRPYTLEEQIQGLIDVFGNKDNPPKKLYCPEKPNTPQNLLKSEKAKEILGWIPQYNWWKACEDMKKEMESHPFGLLG